MKYSDAPTILVPGAAGAAGIGVIKWLKRTGFEGRIVATDCRHLSAGFQFSDRNYVIADIREPICHAEMNRILRNEKVEVIMPTSPTYCAEYAGRMDELSELGTIFPIPEENSVRTCQDKQAFYRTVEGHFPVPKLIPIRDDGPEIYPCFVKPRWGSGSKGVGICRDVHDWLFYSKNKMPLLAQELLEGTEYSVDVLSDMGGIGQLAVVRERLSISDGLSTRVKILRDLEIESLCIRLASHLRLKGVSCMQLKRGRDGQLRFLEVNAHLGGTSIASMIAGVDLVRYLLAISFGTPMHIAPPCEITVMRYFEEIAIG